MLRTKSLPLLLALALLPTVAHAGGKITKVSATVTDGNIRAADVAALQTFHGGLLVSFTEVGLGATQSVTYLVTADASATYACVNNGSNTPNAANKQGFGGPVSVTATFAADKNGKIVGSIGVPPLSSGAFGCPPGQHVELADVSYTNVVITDTTNNVSYSLAGTFSLVFFPI